MAKKKMSIRELLLLVGFDLKAFEKDIRKINIKLKVLDEPMAIRMMRLTRHFSQTDLARRLKVTQPLVSMFETGKVIPGEKLIREIEAALGLSPGMIRPLPEVDKTHAADKT